MPQGAVSEYRVVAVCGEDLVIITHCQLSSTELNVDLDRLL